MVLWSTILVSFRAFAEGTLQKSFHQVIYNDTCIFAKIYLYFTCNYSVTENTK